MRVRNGLMAFSLALGCGGDSGGGGGSDSSSGSGDTAGSDTMTTMTTMTTDPPTTGPATTTGQDSSGSAGSCPEEAEPNDDIDSAVDLGSVACDAGLAMSTGALTGPDDVDWYVVSGDWSCMQGPDLLPEPRAGVVGEIGLSICMYADCEGGTETLTCVVGSEDTAENGAPGCCGVQVVEMNDLDCDGTEDEDATLYIRVEGGTAECSEYELEYRFATEDPP